MKQILAIFLKDARRFWPEILISFALLVALVLAYPRTWRATAGYDAAVGFSRFAFAGGKGFLAGTLVVLVPIAWLVLIARAVHCERLVGTTQYWLTRPYAWWTLLAAKALFLAVFLYAPFFLAQCVLLREAGFQPLHHLGGLLFNLLLLTIVGVLPLLALASLTTGFGRLTLVLLGVVIVIVVTAAISANVPSDTYSSLPDIVSGNLALGVILCGALAVIIVMYALRQAKTGWLFLGALTLGMCSTAFFDPDRALMDGHFPAPHAGSEAPIRFAYLADKFKQPPASQTTDKRGVDIAIPLVESGVQEGFAIVPQALRVTTTDAGGASWQSPWQGYQSAHFLPGDSADMITFRMPRSVYEHFRSARVTLLLTVAMVKARKSMDTTIPLPPGDFNVPGVSVCAPQWLPSLRGISGIRCRSAMNQPELTYVTAPWSDDRCQTDGGHNPDRQLGAAWIGELDPSPAEFGITSVWDTQVNLSNPLSYMTNGPLLNMRTLCPGAPVHFTQFQPESRTRIDVTIPNFRLPELALGDQYLFGMKE